MKLMHFATATAAVALLGGAAYAQQPQPPKAPTPGSVTGDWNGAHAPADDEQYTEEVRVPVGAPPVQAAPSSADASATVGTSVGTDVTAQAEPAPAAATAAQDVSVTTTLVTNGPVPDTPENRARFGGPNSRAGKMTEPAGN
ncbi:MAG: hypothetical protein ACOY5Y_02280 [Pseudomonadota bacterium]|jgi:hypothetical protein